MAAERTLAIIKPDAVAANNIGNILTILENKKFTIKKAQMLRLSKRRAEGFYATHYGKSFFSDLTDFMSSGPILVMVLEGDKAITRWRESMGVTNPAEAAPGTIRKLYGTSVERNATHGSDGVQTAAFEISYFFPGYEMAE